SIDSVSDIEWAENGECIFYTVEEHPHPPRRVFLHELGTDPARDTLVYEETDLQWYVGLDKSRDRKYIFLIAANFDATEVRYIKADQPLSDWKLFAPRRKKVKYFPEHHGDYFYFL